MIHHSKRVINALTEVQKMINVISLAECLFYSEIPVPKGNHIPDFIYHGIWLVAVGVPYNRNSLLYTFEMRCYNHNFIIKGEKVSNHAIVQNIKVVY